MLQKTSRFTPAVLLSLPLFLLAWSGCGVDNPARIRDTTGASFALHCDGDVCDLVPEPGTPPPATCDGQKVWYSYSVGRFVSICSVSAIEGHDGWVSGPSLCRLAVCERDDDCPVLLGRDFVCRTGLCQGDGELGSSHVASLCFDKTPRAADCHAQIENPEVHAVFDLVRETCPWQGESCSVPSSCRQP